MARLKMGFKTLPLPLSPLAGGPGLGSERALAGAPGLADPNAASVLRTRTTTDPSMPRGVSARSYAHARWGRRSLTGGKTRCREPEQGWRCGAGSGGGQLGDPAGR